MSLEELHNVVDDCMQKEGAIRMYYRNNNGQTSIRVVEPLQWENYHVFVAYCNLRHAERFFKLSNILEWQCFDSVNDALAYNANPPEAPVEPPTVLPVQRQLQQSVQIGRPAHNPANLFNQVSTSDEWSRLLKYYAQCIVREHQQQYELNRDYLKPLSVSQGDIDPFLHGEISLDFKIGYQLQQNPIVDFIQRIQQNANLQLCVGYPFLVIGSDKIYPLIYSPIEINANYQSYNLRTEGYEVSYAALKHLQMEDNEILHFLDECDQVTPQPGESVIEALKILLVAKVNEAYQIQLPHRTDKLEPFSIYDGPALFWVTGNQITGNLIQELNTMSEESWTQVPDALNQLLTILPDHEYLAISQQTQDKNLYVTAINEKQVQALHSARTEPVLIVTGPPGTGKSQLVLNLIAQSFMNGETVLFASRNNRAVDVVMGRLQNELKFQGAVRTGSKNNRERAAQRMRIALNSIGTGKEPGAFDRIDKAYQKAQGDSIVAQAQLEEVRKLLGLLASYETERNDYLSFIPKGAIKLIESNIPDYQASELESLQDSLSVFLEGGLGLKEVKSKLEEELKAVEVENLVQFDLIDALKTFEDQWGAFGGGFLRTRQYQKLSDMQAHFHDWLELIQVIELYAQRNQASNAAANMREQLSNLKTQLPAELINQLERCASDYPTQKLNYWASLAKDLSSWFAKNAETPSAFWKRFLHWLRFGRHFKEQTRMFTSLQEKLELKIFTEHEILELGPEGSAVASEELDRFISAITYQHSLAESESLLQEITGKLSTKNSNLPKPINNDLSKLSDFEFDNQPMRNWLATMQSKIEKLEDLANQLGERVNQKILANEDGFQMLTEFASSPAGKDERLWRLFIPIEPDIIVKHVTKWHNILAFWKAHAGMIHVQTQLAGLPSEEAATQAVKTTSDTLLELSGTIMRATWLERAQGLSNDLLQKVHDYVSAVEALAGPYDSGRYRYFKDIEQGNLRHAVNVFPIWATTNLSAKTNFPLLNGYFDVVIIDEASQCDIPSALPLLYRAKRIVIIGDPNQLRHVATLKDKVDLDLAQKYGVSPDAYSYNVHSLFDIASRSAGSHPGTLLLNEHYRSDHRIISFSNHEFYDDKLVIKTDLSVRNIRKTFLNQYGGIFWVNIPGQAERTKGSNFNRRELDSIQTLVPSLSESLRKHEMGSANLGVVTPYRAQEELIQNWARAHFGMDGQLTVGTAHKFQGDERDFMLFSIVAAPGMSEGSLKWLDNEKNLLNVAVTRARITLIVLGNWSYCKSLPASHCFRLLADYVEKQERVVNEINDLPFFGKPATNVIGYLTDPHNPEHNRTTLRKFIASCKEFVWWVDPYLTNRIVDLFWDVFQDSSVTIKQVQLITATEQLHPQKEKAKPELDIKKFNRFRSELREKGVDISLRVMERRGLPHDRWFYSPSQAINMPPFSGAYGDHRHVSEYTQSLTSWEKFLEYWEQAQTISDE